MWSTGIIDFALYFLVQRSHQRGSWLSGGLTRWLWQLPMQHAGGPRQGPNSQRVHCILDPVAQQVKLPKQTRLSPLQQTDRCLISPPTMNVIEQDFRRFSTLHSYYKHLPPDGTRLYMLLKKGEEPRNHFHPSFTDDDGDPHNLHWHFYVDSSLPAHYTRKYFTTGNCFTRGLEYGPDHDPHGFGIMMGRWGSGLTDYLTAKYPQHVADVYEEERKGWQMIGPKKAQRYVFGAEYDEQLEQAVRMARLYEEDLAIGKLRRARKFRDAVERWRHSLWIPGGVFCQRGWEMAQKGVV